MSINIIKRTSYNKTNSCPSRHIKFIVFHYTAGSTSKKGAAINTAAWWATGPNPGSADFVVDDELIVQFNPDLDNVLCWHCGDDRWDTPGGSYYGVCTNANSIGVEVCCNNPNYSIYDDANSPKWSFTNAALSKARELIKYLMQKYGVPVENVIRHYDVSGKPCPGIIGWNTYMGSKEEKWLEFKKTLGGTSVTTTNKTKTNTQTAAKTGTIYRVQCGAFSVKDNADKLAEMLHKKGFKDAYVLKVGGGISDILYRVQCGAFKQKANAEALKTKLQKAGVKDAFITTNSTGTAAKKSVDEIAKEVINGKWGNGADRVNRLTAAGYDAAAVQAAVNKYYGG